MEKTPEKSFSDYLELWPQKQLRISEHCAHATKKIKDYATRDLPFIVLFQIL